MIALAWRYLLVAALVLNPVVGASAAVPASAPAKTPATAMPPCHAMMAAHQAAAAQPAAPAKHGDHGRGCGNAACEFGACCGLGALDVPMLRLAHSLHAGAQALPARDLPAAAAPPVARMIRPPIG
jgi:hypothetical protein